jgi:hypothetical protein
MNFSHTLVGAQEAHQLATTVPDVGDADLRFAVIDAINDAIVAEALTATVSTSSAAEEIQIKLVDELVQLGYAVDGTTTPGSWIVTW